MAAGPTALAPPQHGFPGTSGQIGGVDEAAPILWVPWASAIALPPCPLLLQTNLHFNQRASAQPWAKLGRERVKPSLAQARPIVTGDWRYQVLNGAGESVTSAVPLPASSVPLANLWPVLTQSHRPRASLSCSVWSWDTLDSAVLGAFQWDHWAPRGCC